MPGKGPEPLEDRSYSFLRRKGLRLVTGTSRPPVDSLTWTESRGRYSGGD